MENKCDQTIRKKASDIEMEHTILGMKCGTTNYGNTLVITIDFKGEMVVLFAPKRFDSKAADVEKKFEKLD